MTYTTMYSDGKIIAGLEFLISYASAMGYMNGKQTRKALKESLADLIHGEIVQCQKIDNGHHLYHFAMEDGKSSLFIHDSLEPILRNLCGLTQDGSFEGSVAVLVRKDRHIMGIVDRAFL